MESNEAKIPDYYEVQPRLFKDGLGVFVKTFHAKEFWSLGLNADCREQYYSTASQAILRGLHFQLPPHDHAKLVYCILDSVGGVALDLRVGSPT